MPSYQFRHHLHPDDIRASSDYAPMYQPMYKCGYMLDTATCLLGHDPEELVHPWRLAPALTEPARHWIAEGLRKSASFLNPSMSRMATQGVGLERPLPNITQPGSLNQSLQHIVSACVPPIAYHTLPPQDQCALQAEKVSLAWPGLPKAKECH
ncbi:hypothetical protein CCUS01_15696 [Colletotrichum cuscutae]|uniref:Uncharacterized protein n=1 Tax=Colletotrichum cuscutae TaxID=1209917 RepID=A0AAI9VE64_9PEZI|nr:hypothetical protein CCUS01_15696 [Colletotrichum cuscutae]